MADTNGNGNGTKSALQLSGRTLVPLGAVVASLLLVWDWSAKAARHEEQTQTTLRGLVASVEELRRELRLSTKLREDFNAFVIELRALNGDKIKVPDWQR